ncbi:MAG TPA: LysM peptidoglycan-binding domain-containing protein, partial [Spongiibacteraceae bacterium]
RKFNVDTAALRTTNNLGQGLLRPGQDLLVPQGGRNTTEIAQLNAPAPVTTQTPFGSTQIFHTVQPGENLQRVAQRYAISIKDIQRWNGLGPDDPIKLGQKLNIWTDEVGSIPAKITATSQPKKVGYTVQNGDSLTAIAGKFNVEIEDILRWNQVNARALLQPGQRLTLFLGK